MIALLNRNSLFYLALFCQMLLLNSCSEDELSPTGKKLVLTFVNVGLSSTAEIYVTDPDGNLLESQSANGQMNFFTTNESSPYYHLTIIDLLSANSYSIKTYQQVPSSSYFIKNTTSATVAGLHRISFPSITDYKNFNMQSEHLKNILPVSDTEFDLELTQTKSDLFLTLENDGNKTPSFLLVQQAEVGKTTALDAGILNTFIPMTAKLINEEQSLTNSYHYQIHGNINSSTQLLVSSYNPSTIFTPSPLYLYYPAPVSLFKDFTTQISFDVAKGNYLATITQIQTGSTPSESNEQLDIKLINYQQTAGNYQFNLTGNAEWTHAQFQAIQGDKSIYWDVFTPFSEQNAIQIPDFLINYLNEKQFTFANEMQFRLIECSNDAATLNYGDFLRLELKKDTAPPSIQNRVTTGYYLPQ